MAFVRSFGRWYLPDPDEAPGDAAEGEIPCWLCEGKDDDCPDCRGIGTLYISGTPEQNSAGRDMVDYDQAVYLSYISRERAWAPTELFSESAKWVDAMRFITPFILREILRRMEEAKSNAAKSS